MRITNKIMQRNSLNNINSNKELQDNLTTQMSTQKKINRASDDPVVAIRALRLRSNVTEVSQYYSKNIPDADSWLQVTEDALKNTTSIITKMIEQVTRGSNGDLTSDDRKIIMEQLTALGDEVYKTGDASYAGRYVFTGYRTDTSLSFQENRSDKTYNITEQLTRDSIDKVKYVNTGKLTDWTNANFNSGDIANITERDVEPSEVYRIRLAYENLDGVSPTIEYTDPSLPTPPSPNSTILPADIETMNSTETAGFGTDSSGKPITDPYTYVMKNDDKVVLLKDTGELLIGKDLYEKLMATRDDSTTAVTNEGEIRITYEKTDFTAEDLRPEHYYSCSARDAGTPLTDVSKIEYNKDYLDGIVEKQSIEYDVGFNQTIRVNSTADEAFDLGIGREVDDLVASLQKLQRLEDICSGIKAKMNETAEGSAEMDTLKNQYNASLKAFDYAKDINQKRFESAITTFQDYLNESSLSITNVGTRSSKLELIKSRMQNQKTTFETLKSENEDIDITEVAIQLSSSEMTYQAALTATGKIIQNSLISYI